MAMSPGGSAQRAEINVTPLIDVLLVLLIIFLIITPSLSTGLNALVPQESDEKQPSVPRDDIVLSVLGDGTVRINEETVAIKDLSDRLKAVFKNAGNHVIFIRGGKDLDFNQIAEVIDIAKGAGLERVALMTN